MGFCGTNPLMMEELLDLIAAASFSLGLFGAVLCFLHRRDVWPFRALAAVLLASCATIIDDVAWPIASAQVALNFQITAAIAWLIGVLAIPPLFWHYVCAITSVTPRLPTHLWIHAVLPCIAACLGLAVVFMPEAARMGLFMDNHALPTGWPYFVGVAGELLVLVGIVQWGGYLVAIIRRLLRYRKRLREYVTSTEQGALGWIWAIITLFSCYWAMTAIDAVLELTGGRALVAEWFEASVALGLLVIILLNGLRQRPNLAPDVIAPPEVVTKYGRSALTPEMAARIERKLRAAMTDDFLHRDPNLSLWSLARHIGASPNYISQTLNENIGDSFFDFVNGYRIEDAQTLLRDTDQTVLTITYDVGFNSRSSFYTAFKKVTGQTPTAFRVAVSAPA